VKTRFSLVSLIVFSVIALLLAACGAKPVSVAELPVYPEAVQLEAGDSAIADTLENNMAQDAAMRDAMGPLGGGGKTEQAGFQLPSDTSWEQVKAFYAKELEDNGWSSGLGGVAGIVDVNAMMDTANQDNDLYQIAIWSKGKQTLAVIYAVAPTNQDEKLLLLSLSSR
jgi:hypothetical protein